MFSCLRNQTLKSMNDTDIRYSSFGLPWIVAEDGCLGVIHLGLPGRYTSKSKSACPPKEVPPEDIVP